MSYSNTALAETIGSPVEFEGPGFEPEAILPEQFLAEARSQATGERLLLIALLQDAINCFQKYLFATRARSRRLFREAEQWIMEPDTRARDESMHPYFSFEQTCCFLRLDPDYVRDKLLRWKQQQLAAGSQPKSPSRGVQWQRSPSSNQERQARPALVSRGPVSVGQDYVGKPSDVVRARRAVERIAS